MLRRSAVADFLQREAFYVAVVFFDLFALGMYLLVPSTGGSAGPKEAVRHFEDLDRVFDPRYLAWAGKKDPVLVYALFVFLSVLLIAAIVGVALWQDSEECA